MSEEGASYHDALAEAQRLGYAERDPTADVEGYDAAAKAAILASVAFGVRVVAGDVYREGISSITPADIAFARRLGYVIKLLAVIERTDDDRIDVRVHPAMVPVTHPLASVRDSFNAVFIEGDAVGELMLLGRGAGGMPTASAVLGDLLDAAHNLPRRRRGPHGALAPGLDPADRRPGSPLLPHPRGGRPPGGPGRGVRGLRRSLACRSARWSRRGSGPKPGSSSSPTRPASATSRLACTSCASSTWWTASAA